jgi:hypothetical protein
MYLDRQDVEPNPVLPIEEQLLDAVGAYLDGLDQGESNIWKIAHLLVEYAGRCGPNGAHNGAADKIRELLDKVKARYPDRSKNFSFSYAERLRFVASNFPPHKIVGGVSFHCHWVAGDPETLGLAMAAAQRLKVKLTGKFISDFVDSLNDEQDSEKADQITTEQKCLRALAFAARYVERLVELGLVNPDNLDVMEQRAQRISEAIGKLRSMYAERRAA